MPAILDGTGAGFRAKVNSLNQLKTSSVSEDAEAFATDLGDAYQIVSGRLTLTSGSPSAVLYVQNLDCLLYTSPSPRDRTRSRMPSSA